MVLLQRVITFGLVSVASLALVGCGGSHMGASYAKPTTSNKTAQRIFNTLPSYQKLAHQAWPPIYAHTPLKLGQHDASVPQIRQRLIQLGDLSKQEASEDTLYSTQLSRAVARFQWRHGLQADGVYGDKTQHALNVTPRQRLHQLAISMNRWAKFPEGEGEHYVRVNAANYRLAIVKDGNKVMDMRVIVGKPSRETPELYSKVQTIVFNPKWNVPTSIAKKDIIPKIIKDPNYLAENNIVIYDKWGKDAKQIDPATIDWNKALTDGFPYRFTQKSGDDNALGRIKFVFQNSEDIYMHDTPHKALFDEVQRAYSSGCIRVAEPYRLVNYFIKDNKDPDYEKLNDYLSSGNIKYVKIDNPVPIYITYITAWVDEQGKAHFREDIYKRDT